jgi:hypothetical protein
MKEGAPKVMLLGRPGCHLCASVEKELRSMDEVPELSVVNIDEDRALYDKYLLRIPIVIVEGSVVFEGSMMDLKGEWKERLVHQLGSSRNSDAPELP